VIRDTARSAKSGVRPCGIIGCSGKAREFAVFLARLVRRASVRAVVFDDLSNDLLSCTSSTATRPGRLRGAPPLRRRGRDVEAAPSADEAQALAAHGGRIVVYELQG